MLKVELEIKYDDKTYRDSYRNVQRVQVLGTGLWLEHVDGTTTLVEQADFASGKVTELTVESL